MTDKLKPCPFIQECHADKNIDSTVRVRPFMKSYFVSCGGCAASGPMEKTEAEAIAAWNKRAPDPAHDAGIRAEGHKKGWEDFQRATVAFFTMKAAEQDTGPARNLFNEWAGFIGQTVYMARAAESGEAK